MKKDDVKVKLRDLLRVIFQFDSEDLDFGIYKIMNYKRKEIEQFINKELIDKINEQLKLLNEEEKGKAGDELEKLKNQIKDSFGDDAFHNGKLKKEFANTPLGKKYLKQREQLNGIKISEELESKIYNHIFSFFSRYYDRGDFISKRRYGRKDKYVVPYSGEEVLLHWANRDQYYVKTTEYFSKYTFKTKNISVNFRVVDAQEEKGNIKAPEKKYFVLNEDKVKISGNEIDVYFEFRGLTGNESKKFGERAKQDEINRHIYDVLKKKLENESKTVPLFDKKGDKTVLEKHLNKYTRRNTSDYFIHKNLKEFLEGELDYYIKNEVLNLEDLRRLEKEKVAPYLLEAQVIRNISLKIIEFLAQIENFQKKVWEKKKFVIKTEYVITLDKIREYAGDKFIEKIASEVVKNKEQLREWEKLIGVKVKEKKDLMDGKEWKKLPIDTKNFSEDFKWELIIALSEKNDLDEILDGVLIKGENWQALNLLINKYREKIKSTYLDPPFNSKATEILYKNNYKHSSWISLMENRISLNRFFLQKDGVLIIAIDENEQEKLGLLLNNLFNDYDKTCVTIVHNPRGIQGKNFSYCHEYAYFVFPRNNRIIGKRTIPKDQWEYSSLRVWGGESERETGRSVFYPIYVKNGKIIRLGDVPSDDFHPEKQFIEKDNGEIEVWPIDKNGVERKWRYSKKELKKKLYAIRVKSSKEEVQILIAQTHESFKTNWVNSIYDAGTYGTRLLTNMGLKEGFTFPKSLHTVKDCLYAVVGNMKNAIILDFFAGSGTTAHAAMKLNEEDGGKRKFILVEIAEYFDNVIIPRIKKVAYSFNWKDGNPQDMSGLGLFLKYNYLEHYEDSLENIEFEQKSLDEYKDYFVKYMLDFETQNSKTFLNIEGMEDPFNYKLRIIEDYEPRIINVDLVETFNYLIGLSVSKYRIINENGRKYVFVYGERNAAKALIVWREIKDIDFKKDKETIEKVRKEFVPDETYVNGDCGVKDFRQIETEFKSLLW